MGQHLEEKIPNMGMNKDDENRLMDKSESRFILNLRAGSSDDENVGAVENIKGNTEVVFDIPYGKNKVIGSHGDQTTHSNFFFLWNSLGKHTVYRFLEDTKEVRILSQDTSFSTDGELLNFKEYDLINDINVVDNLLYWRDYENPPRKLNIDKSDNDNPDRRQVFHWYLGDKYLENQTNLLIKVETKPKRYGTAIGNANYTFSINQSLGKADLAKDLANQINAVTSVNWNARACGEFVNITMTDAQFYQIFSLDSASSKTHMIIPQNSYVGYVERTIDVIKHPPHCELKAEIKTDETFHRNYIQKKVFQFAVRYIYDDDEKSTVNPYSIHIYNKFICEQFTGENIGNYIRIDLSVFKELTNVLDLQTIRGLEIFVREGELGLWKTVKVLEQHEFVDISDQHFDFYNDGIYDVVDQNDFVRPFDLVPQRTKNQEVAKNRLFYANNLEGYNNICVDAKVDIEYDDVESRIKAPTHDVSGVLIIRSMFNGNIDDGNTNGRTPAKYQGIYRDMIPVSPFGSVGGTSNFPVVWGGISEGAGGDPNVKGMAGKTGQVLNRGGFTVYLAGTDFNAKTKQNVGQSHSNVSQDTDGVYFVSDPNNGQTLIDKLRENMRNQSGATSSPLILDPSYWGDFQQFQGNGGGVDRTQVYSTFNIQNVPDGWYILRVASHTITDEALEDPDRSWQRTSTNVYQITNLDAQDNPSIVGYKESAIRGRGELLINVRGGNIPRIKIEIMDLSHASDFGSSKIMTGYVCDRDVTPLSNTFQNIFSDTRISRAGVIFDINPGDTNFDIFPNSAECGGKTAITDHNGYFYYGSIDSLAKLGICQIKAHDINAIYGVNQIQEVLGRNTSNIGENEYREVAIRVNDQATEQTRVKVIGSIKDNTGNAIPKSSIVSIRAEVAKCDNNGDYEFWHYGIRISGAGNPSLDTYLIPIRTGLTCSAFYEEDQIYNYAFNHPSWWQGWAGYATYFNAPNQVSTPSELPLKLSIPFFEGDVSNLITLNAMKRGWDGKFGIVYYDRGLRSGAVNTEERLEVHIPFYSEKDKDDLIKVGVPIINWEIKHRPPSWATHWQWVRTRNTTVGDYYQWAVKTATYQTTDGNPSSYTSGTRVVLDVTNLSTYKGQYPSMDLEVPVDNETYRVRFIKNDLGSRYVEYFDTKVLEVNGNLITIEKEFEVGEIKQGTLIEIYNEKLDIENDIYFEFGECFEVKENNSGIKYHAGLTQDQDPITPFSVPAKGVFRTGDAYYRLRGIPDGGINGSSYIDDDAVSDFYPSEVESIGRPNAENSDAAQLWKTNQIRHSGKYIPDSKVNNLSRFESSDFNNLPIEYGAINKLQLSSNVLMSIHEFRWVSNYIEEVIMRKQAGGDELQATTDVFGSFRAAKEITGTINQESVKEYRGAIYAFDLNKGEVYRWAGDGLTPISSYKMINYFTDKSRDILKNIRFSQVPVRIIGVYDTKFSEYILSFSELIGESGVKQTAQSSATYKLGFDINNSETIESTPDNSLLSIKTNKESGSNLLIDELTSPELKDVKIDNRNDSTGVLSVKVKRTNGQIDEIIKLEPGQSIKDFNISNGTYEPAPTDDYANPPRTSEGNVLVKGETIAFNERIDKWTTFYSFRPEMFGVIDLTLISFLNGRLWVHNSNNLRNNFYGVQYTSQIEAMFNELPGQVKVFQAIGVESRHPWHIPFAKTPNGMETEVVAARFERKEDSYFASIMRDKNDPTFIGKPSIDAIINGRQLRDRSIKVLLENTETKEVVLFGLSMMSTLSSRHQK